MSSKVIGIVLLVIGLIMIVYTGFNYVTTETVVDAGPIQIEAKKNNFLKFSPIIGIVLVVGGLIVMLSGKKSTN
jgi:uncharacterized membrane protein YidH (DUF202 family)